MDNFNTIDNEDDLSANHYDLNDSEIREMLQRREDYLSGKMMVISWNEIKERNSKSEIKNPNSEIH